MIQEIPLGIKETVLDIPKGVRILGQEVNFPHVEYWFTRNGGFGIIRADVNPEKALSFAAEFGHDLDRIEGGKLNRIRMVFEARLRALIIENNRLELQGRLGGNFERSDLSFVGHLVEFDVGWRYGGVGLHAGISLQRKDVFADAGYWSEEFDDHLLALIPNWVSPSIFRS